MNSVVDITGLRFGKLVVQSFAGRTSLGTGKQKRSMWVCLCDCGAQPVVDGSAMKRGSTASCGCGREAWLRYSTHGLTRSDVYSCWKMMIRRCTDKRDKDFSRYGGRGITVCPEWFDLRIFAGDMGPRPKGFTVDRIDNDLGYCAENCRWATPVGQSNNMRANHILTLGGESHTVSEWSNRIGVKLSTLFGRLARGYPVEDVLAKRSFSRRGLTLSAPLLRVHTQ